MIIFDPKNPLTEEEVNALTLDECLEYLDQKTKYEFSVPRPMFQSMMRKANIVAERYIKDYRENHVEHKQIFNKNEKDGE